MQNLGNCNLSFGPLIAAEPEHWLLIYRSDSWIVMPKKMLDPILIGWGGTEALSFTLVAQRIKQAPVDVVGLEFE